MIDLHTHSTASDGRLAPADLVARAAEAGVTVLAVTDHDTVAACSLVAAACADAGLEYVPGIEITAVRDGGDVHVLGYFFDVGAPALLEFLGNQRAQRIDRVRQMIRKLASVGLTLDADRILQPALDDPSKAAGRPWIARALVEAGHVESTDDAFDRWLARGRPAFVPRAGASVEEVIAQIHRADGLASLAHPVLVREDDWIGSLAPAGLDALEVFHSEHDATSTARYLALAGALGLGVTGGSDFHGDPSHGPDRPGAVSLPSEHYRALLARWSAGRQATSRATASGERLSS